MVTHVRFKKLTVIIQSLL